MILDLFGAAGYKLFAVIYPTVVGALAAVVGYQVFKRGDLP